MAVRKKFNYDKLVKEFSTADADNEQPDFSAPATLIDIDFSRVDSRKLTESRWIAFTFPNLDGKGDVIFGTTVGGYNWFGARFIREVILKVTQYCKVDYTEAERLVWDILERYHPHYGIHIPKR